MHGLSTQRLFGNVIYVVLYRHLTLWISYISLWVSTLRQHRGVSREFCMSGTPGEVDICTGSLHLALHSSLVKCTPRTIAQPATVVKTYSTFLAIFYVPCHVFCTFLRLDAPCCSTSSHCRFLPPLPCLLCEVGYCFHHPKKRLGGGTGNLRKGEKRGRPAADHLGRQGYGIRRGSLCGSRQVSHYLYPHDSKTALGGLGVARVFPRSLILPCHS